MAVTEPGAERPRNPRGEGSRLREQLVAAAVEVIDEVGDAERVSVRAIARRAGVSPTALYLHFPDRDALVDAAVDAGFAAFNAALLEAAAREEASPRVRLAAMGHAYVGFAERQPALYAVLFTARRLPPKDSPTAAVDREAGFAGLVALARAALDPARADEAPEVAIAIWTSMHGFATLRSAGAPVPWPTPDDYIARLIDAQFGPDA